MITIIKQHITIIYNKVYIINSPNQFEMESYYLIIISELQSKFQMYLYLIIYILII